MSSVIQQQILGSAHAQFDGSRLTVDTGVVQRSWRVIPCGLGTCSFRRTGGAEWIPADDSPPCDWELTGFVDAGTVAAPGSIEMRSVTDVQRSSDHVEVVVPFTCEGTGIEIRYRIWVYPGAAGIRTQLALRVRREFGAEEMASYQRPSFCERIRHVQPPEAGRAAGYYNGTQQRNWDHTPILQEWDLNPERNQTIDWASLLQLRQGGECLTLLKESHKCVNQSGVQTGEFVVSPIETRVTGLGPPLRLCAKSPDDFHDGWATWSLLSRGDFDEARADLKRFDRARFPFRPDRDALIMANTWGSGGAREGSRRAAEERNVLREMKTAAELGVDLIQIDDGWQSAPGSARPFDVDWTPNPERWPEGWKNVREASERLGVDLGLWQTWKVPAEAIIANRDAGGFRRFKIDFMEMHGYHQVEEMLALAGAISEGHPEIGINWDATENEARMGYWFGREHGNIYLENRPAPPEGMTRIQYVAYKPRLVLRDGWHLARYMNLNQIQLTIQNVDRVNRDWSNAHKHPHAYCFAITMMGVPIFFQEIQLYSAEAREELRPLVHLYRQHRERLFAGWVEPIGDEPDDTRWTGFQNTHPDGNGYLTVFREIENREPEATLAVPALAGTTVRLRDLEREETREVTIGEDGCIPFRIDVAPGYRFVAYERLG